MIHSTCSCAACREREKKVENPLSGSTHNFIIKNSAKGPWHSRTCQVHRKQLSIWHGAMPREPLVSFWVWRRQSGKFDNYHLWSGFDNGLRYPNMKTWFYLDSSTWKCYGNVVSALAEAPCTEIIQRANSTIDYDLRDQPESLERPVKMPRVCPVLWDLYRADFNKSDTKTIINSTIFHHGFLHGSCQTGYYWQWMFSFWGPFITNVWEAYQFLVSASTFHSRKIECLMLFFGILFDWGSRLTVEKLVISTVSPTSKRARGYKLWMNLGSWTGFRG